MRRKTTIILTALIMACSVTACQGAADSISKSISGNRDTDKTDTPETSVSADAEDTADTKDTADAKDAADTGELSEEEEQALYNTYIEVNNFMLGRVNDSLDRYFNYVDIEQEEFTLLDEDDDYFDCYSLSDSKIEEVEYAYEMASSKGDKSALDEAFLDVYPSLSTVISTLNDIETYTEMKSYLDDDYQKAKEYHATLMEALWDYLDKGDVFMSELDIVASEQQEKDLADMKAEGYEVLYTMNKVLILAGDIESELSDQDVWDENILDMDLEKIQPLYDEFVANVDALLAYSEDEEKVAAEGIPVNSAWWSSFIRDMKDTKVSLTEVLQKVKDGEELSYSDLMITEIAGNCSLSSFDTGYSALINDYNNMVSY